jgi:hypothetical protein
MRLRAYLAVLATGTLVLCGCSKRQGSIEGYVRNLGMVDQADMVVQITESGMIVADASTDGNGDYEIAQIEPGDYEAYLKYGDPGAGSQDTLKSSTRVRWRRSPSVAFAVEGGLIADPDDLTRYTLYQARLSSCDVLAGFLFANASNKVNALVALEDSADFFVTRNGQDGVTFGTTGYASVADAGTDSLEVSSAVPAGGYQDSYSFATATDCIGGNYVVKCRNGKYAKLHILDSGVESPAGDTLAYGYVTFLSFYMLTDSTHFPEIPAN